LHTDIHTLFFPYKNLDTPIKQNQFGLQVNCDIDLSDQVNGICSLQFFIDEKIVTHKIVVI